MSQHPGSGRQALTAVALTAGLLSLTGCAAHVTRASVSATPAARTAAASPRLDDVSRARLTERYEHGAERRRLAAEALAALDVSFEEGRAAWLAGDIDAATASFDKAIGDVLELDVDLASEPALAARLEEVMASIHELAVSDAATDDLPRVDETIAASGQTPRCVVPEHVGPYSIPVVCHPSVDSMIAFYTGRAKERFELGLRRYGLYAPTVARILKEEGVPQDLAWLAIVESNYNTQAHSHARAKGLWQFIPSTGRRYGLAQDFWVDERSDFEKETRSAARYMKDLHAMFGDWYLALAAYNAGEGKIGRAIRATGTKDFWAIRQSRHIRRETKDYVPAFLAVNTIVRDPARYGINFAPSEPLSWEMATVASCTDLGVLAECAGTTPEQLALLNPELRRGTTPGGDTRYTLRVPAGSATSFAEKYAALPPEHRLKWQQHVVRRGDTLNQIATIYGTTVPAIMAANGLKSANRISVGWSLVIPAGGSATGLPPASLRGLASLDDDPPPASRSRRSYRVRPGDTLGLIARRNGVSVSSLCEWNGLRNSNRIHVGQRLTIHGGRQSAPQAASASRASSSPSRVHVVRRGDTLSAIAVRYGVTVGQLRSWNRLSSRSVIRPGQRLTVKGSGARAALDATEDALETPLAPEASHETVVVAMKNDTEPPAPSSPPARNQSATFSPD